MIERTSKGTLLHIWVKTRAKKQIVHVSTDLTLCEVSVKAEPARGEANREVVKFLAKQLRISSDKLRLVAGIRSAKKILLIEGMEPADVLALLRS